MIFLDLRQLNYTAAFQYKETALMCLFEFASRPSSSSNNNTTVTQPCSKTECKMDIFNTTLKTALFLLQVSGKKLSHLNQTA